MTQRFSASAVEKHGLPLAGNQNPEADETAVVILDDGVQRIAVNDRNPPAGVIEAYRTHAVFAVKTSTLAAECGEKGVEASTYAGGPRRDLPAPPRGEAWPTHGR